MSGRSVSMDTPLSNGEDNTLLDVMSDTDSAPTDALLNHESLALELKRALQNLPDRERDIVESCYGIGCEELSLEEIGLRFGLTRERVRQIKEKALRHMKNINGGNLRAFLG